MYAIIEKGYISGFGYGDTPTGGIDITDKQGVALMDSFKTCPVVEDGYVAKLNLDGTWDIIEGESQEISNEEALNILLGESK